MEPENLKKPAGKVTKFGGREVKFRKMNLEDCNKIIVPVTNSVGRMVLGNTDLFSNWHPTHFEIVQDLLCEYVSWADTGKNITLFDISEFIDQMLCLQFEFLEFNFKVFSQSQEIVNRIVSQDSGTEDKKMKKRNKPSIISE